MKKEAEKAPDFFDALLMLEKEKGVKCETLLEKIKTAIALAVKKDYPYTENFNIDIDPETRKFQVSLLKTVVDDPYYDIDNEILLEEAQKYNPSAALGDTVEIPLETHQFGRIAAQSAKQLIRQGIKEVERMQLSEAYQSKLNEVVSATVLRIEPRSGNITLEIDKSEVPLFKSELCPGEVLHEGDIIKVYAADVMSIDKRPTLKVSRKHRDLVKRLFEMEVPEIYDGTVEVKAISREAGFRTKIAVSSKDPNVDAVGACIGPRGQRVSKIVDELGGEKIDIVKYSEEPAEFIAGALAPSEVIDVEILDAEARACRVVVPDSQLSLAIGNKGQNAKLAARLTGYKIDIKSLSAMNELREQEQLAQTNSEETD